MFVCILYGRILWIHGCIHDVNLLICLLEAFDLENHVIVLILISK